MKPQTQHIGAHRLPADVWRPSDTGQSPAVLFIIGWTSGRDRYFDYAQELSRKGYICLTFDPRGHGESKGDLHALSRQDFLDDVESAYDYLASYPEVDQSNIHVVGFSFGGYLSTLLSCVRSVKSMVLRAPANYPDDGFDEAQYKQVAGNEAEAYRWRAKKLLSNGTRSLNALSQFDGRVLIVESELDEFVPAQTLNNYQDAAKKASKVEYIIMKNAPHSINHDPKFQKQFLQILLNWFADHS